jgi:hypothetical protein
VAQEWRHDLERTLEASGGLLRAGLGRLEAGVEELEAGVWQIGREVGEQLEAIEFGIAHLRPASALRALGGTAGDATQPCQPVGDAALATWRIIRREARRGRRRGSEAHPSTSPVAGS